MKHIGGSFFGFSLFIAAFLLAMGSFFYPGLLNKALFLIAATLFVLVGAIVMKSSNQKRRKPEEILQENNLGYDIAPEPVPDPEPPRAA